MIKDKNNININNKDFDPYSKIINKKFKSQIIGKNKEIIFDEEVIFPDFFDENSVNIVANKYLCNNSKTKETNLTTLIDRVSNTIKDLGLKNNYFKNEDDATIFCNKLKYYQVHQYFAFNSPVYFNVGLKDNFQASACFINEIDDNMDSIFEVGKIESRIFKQGSGSGMNMSKLRGSSEPVSLGGYACLTGDTQLINDYKFTIKELYDNKLNNRLLPMIKCVKDNFKFGNNQIINIVYNGKQEVFEIVTEYGYKIKATHNHRFLSVDDYKEVSQFNIGENIGTYNIKANNQVYFDKILSITPCGIEDVYDIQMEAPYHNFIANGFVSHNSGPVSFMKCHDVIAGVIRSGGTLRRSAKLVCLDVDHPDIMDFIECKKREEDKFRILRESGLNPQKGYEISDDVFFQNTNISVRLSDIFIEAVKLDKDWHTRNRTNNMINKTYKAKDILRKIAELSWETGDPGVQFDDNVNKWNTCINDGRIRASNPCLPKWAPVLTPEGYKHFGDINNEVLIDNKINKCSDVFYTGKQNIYDVELQSGISIYATGNHLISTYNGDKPIECLNIAYDKIKMDYTPVNFELNTEEYEKGLLAGFLYSDGTIHYNQHNKLTIGFSLGIKEFDYEDFFLNLIKKYIPDTNHKFFSPHNQKPNTCKVLTINKNSSVEYFIKHIFKADSKDKFDLINKNNSISYQKGFIESVLSCDGFVNNRIKDYVKHVGITQSGNRGYNILKNIQIVLASFGIYSSLTVKNYEKLVDRNDKIYKHQTFYNLIINDVWEFNKIFNLKSKEKQSIIDDIVSVNKLHSTKIKNLKKYQSIKKITKLYEEDVYDINVPIGNHFVSSCAVVHNCSEFVFLDNSACNLASINLIKFFDGELNFKFDVFKDIIETIIVAQDILCETSSYPTEKIKNNSLNYRPLGLGYTNLGCLLMTCGLPYDSEEGRFLAGSITALMHFNALSASSKIAEKLGSFKRYENNKDCFHNVIDKHAEEIIRLEEKFNRFDKNNFTNENLVKTIENLIINSIKTCNNEVINKKYFRNSQVTLLAPTGTISWLMGADTTGIEPDFSLIKCKRLSGSEGATINYVNNSIPKSLKNLGYDENEINNLMDELRTFGHFENSKILKSEHQAVFHTSIPPMNGKYSISHIGHLEMISTVQKFLSGAISKTINVNNDFKIEDIENLILKAHDMGVKGICIYRDGSKNFQPLTNKKETTINKEISVNKITERIPLPDERPAIVHKFKINNSTKGYLTCGHYPDGKIGEIFINVSKEGSTLSGLLDALATVTSISLQFGVPLEAFCKKLMFHRFEPSGFTNNPEIRTTTSIVDYIFRYLAHKYLNNTVKDELGLVKNNNNKKEYTESSPPCDKCGSLMIRLGSCYNCKNCGESQGSCG